MLTSLVEARWFVILITGLILVVTKETLGMETDLVLPLIMAPCLLGR